ncbi:mitochondrial glyco protein [Pseudovirgaria hyperparasitica]|uniref:Mitochondrial glyco protein n=1 Tax=Pseudovirgaria hyperparasitica TaxID=470096 RepID=A0A6A6W7T5_9PEZI|nr:mitochondrial glyco protein [Pseudovirgaria hyperparasitica]KAF2758269.1 mitochondrial glyco protein [Pseudovirgaria hyperparasitica]
MMSLRSCMRFAPRVLNSVSKTARPQASILRNSPFLRTTWAPTTPKVLSSFHTSAARRDATSQELEAMLRQEAEYEEKQVQAMDSENYSPGIKEYLENSAFTLEDIPGNDEVSLTRQYENEKITVTFSILDLVEEDPDSYEQDEMYDEEDLDMEGQSGGANTKGSANVGSTQDGNIKVAPEDRVSPADRPELEEDEFPEQARSFPARITVKIERPGKGAVSVEATLSDGETIIDNIYYYEDAALATPKSADKEWARRDLFAGPRYSSLDPNLQTSFEQYLQERGINERMAIFIPDYIDFKEQREYGRWLNNMRNFFSE